MRYSIIYADPPWRFTGLGAKGIRSSKRLESGLHRNIPLEEKYATLSLEELEVLPVEGICTKDAVLFLWTTDAHLPQAPREGCGT